MGKLGLVIEQGREGIGVEGYSGIIDSTYVGQYILTSRTLR